MMDKINDEDYADDLLQDFRENLVSPRSSSDDSDRIGLKLSSDKSLSHDGAPGDNSRSILKISGNRMRNQSGSKNSDRKVIPAPEEDPNEVDIAKILGGAKNTDENIKAIRNWLNVPDYVPPSLFLLVFGHPQGSEKKTVCIACKTDSYTIFLDSFQGCQTPTHSRKRMSKIRSGIGFLLSMRLWVSSSFIVRQNAELEGSCVDPLTQERHAFFIFVPNLI